MRLSSAAVTAGFRLSTHDTLASTNVEALTSARGGERGPLWVVAREQTAGRGRRGHAWVSPRGNLYATLLLTDPASAECARRHRGLRAGAARSTDVEMAERSSLRQRQARRHLDRK
jgi:BirA family transcriptional regulator, biotin operon repressor / biotin---[acetyl-CoA-carboxylase] ligase